MTISLFPNINILKKSDNLRSIIVLNNFLAENKFIFFCNINKIKNSEFLILKNKIKNLNCKSLIANSRLLKLDDKFFDFKFLGTHILIISASNLENLLNLINFLDKDHI